MLDTLYVLTSRPVIPVQDTALIRMRREAFSEDALHGYSQVLDQIFATMITNTNGQLDIDRETYGVGKKFVMVHLSTPSATCYLVSFVFVGFSVSVLTPVVHLCARIQRTRPNPL